MQKKGLRCQSVIVDPLPESIKGKASMVDSSLTECKNDTGKCDGLENSINKENEECDAATEDEQPYCFSEAAGSSPMKNVKPNTRYFIIKSLNHHNIQLSVEKGIWATQVMNEPILEEAFHNSDRVILIFSVNMSGFFQGYAEMLSPVGWRRDNVWSKSSSRTNPWGRSFKVRWLQLCDLPFQKTLHLKNPLNDYKPVKISRDCQELSAEIGEALCGLFDGEVDKGKLKRNNFFMDDVLLKRPCRSSVVHYEDDECMFSVPSSYIKWAGATMPHPSLLSPYVQHEKHTHNVMLARSPWISFLQDSHSYLESESVLHVNEPFISTSLKEGQGVNEFLISNKKETSREGNFAVSLSEEDILNMTYEEYLEAIARTNFSSPHLASASVGTGWDYPGFAGK